jgi:hypothetical protein
MKAAGEILPELLRKRPQKQVPAEDLVREAWEHLVGRQVAARTQVFRLYRDILTVHVPDKVWKRQLFRLERQLLARINHFLGRNLVASIDFRVDEKMIAPVIPTAPAALQGTLFDGHTFAAAPRKGPGHAAAIQVDPDVARAAEAIADPELRELFLRTSRRLSR